MLQIDIENKKGVLFIRLDGELSQDTIKKWNDDVKSLIESAGIRNVVFNMTNLTYIDLKGVNSLYYGYELCKNNHGSSIICGVNENIRDRLRKSRILHYIKESDSELSALNMINI